MVRRGRDPAELPEEFEFDEATLVADLGMRYENVGFQDPDTLTDEIFDRVRALLKDPAKKPILLHCSSANRVGAVWLAHQVLDDGLGFDDALAEATTVGLRVPALEAKAKGYIQRQQKKREAVPRFRDPPDRRQCPACAWLPLPVGGDRISSLAVSGTSNTR